MESALVSSLSSSHPISLGITSDALSGEKHHRQTSSGGTFVSRDSARASRNATCQNSRSVRASPFRPLRVSASSPSSSSPSPTPSTSPVLRVMISGAPASGKGTQCEEIVKKFNLTHISAGDLLRAEVAAGTEYGKQVSSYMDAGKLVPDEVVITIVKNRLAALEAVHSGWLLDGYPRSKTQMDALEEGGIHPDVFILLQVPDSILVERVVGRRLDPVTNRIYHLSFSPPENEEIEKRLVQRSDDTEEKVKARLHTHNENVNAVVSGYQDVLVEVFGDRPKNEVFADIESVLNQVREKKQKEVLVPSS